MYVTYWTMVGWQWVEVVADFLCELAIGRLLIEYTLELRSIKNKDLLCDRSADSDSTRCGRTKRMRRQVMTSIDIRETELTILLPWLIS